MQVGVPHAAWSARKVGVGDEVKADFPGVIETGPVPQTEGLNDKFGFFKWDILRLGMLSADKGVLLVYQLDRLTNIHTRLHHSLLLQVDKFRFPRSLEVFSPNRWEWVEPLHSIGDPMFWMRKVMLATQEDEKEALALARIQV